MEINIFHFFIRAFRKCLRINQLLKTERCRSTFRLNFLASCWLLVSPCAMRSPPTYRRGDLAVLTSIYTHQACNKASWLKSRVAIVSILAPGNPNITSDLYVDIEVQPILPNNKSVKMQSARTNQQPARSQKALSKVELHLSVFQRWLLVRCVIHPRVFDNPRTWSTIARSISDCEFIFKLSLCMYHSLQVQS